VIGELKYMIGETDMVFSIYEYVHLIQCEKKSVRISANCWYCGKMAMRNLAILGLGRAAHAVHMLLLRDRKRKTIPARERMWKWQPSFDIQLSV
jgi:hypothetical protein